jgi:hypothetical protein
MPLRTPHGCDLVHGRHSDGLQPKILYLLVFWYGNGRGMSIIFAMNKSQFGASRRGSLTKRGGISSRNASDSAAPLAGVLILPLATLALYALVVQMTMEPVPAASIFRWIVT